MKNLLRREQTQREKAPCKGGSGISYVATKNFLEQLGVEKGKGTENHSLANTLVCACSLWGWEKINLCCPRPLVIETPGH